MPQAAAVTREMPMLTLRANVEPSTFDEEKRTVELVWTTGAKGLRHRWVGWDGVEAYYEELEVSSSAIRMDRLNNGAPLLADHNSYGIRGVIGVVERAWLKDGEGRAVVRFSDRAEVQGVFQDVKNGILRNVSVGYNVHKYDRIEAEKRGEPDTYRAVDWEPMELSIVPIGFDDGAKVRGAERGELHQVLITTRGAAADIEENKMPKENAVVENNATDEKVAEARTAGEQAGVAAERARVTEIRASVRKAGLGDELADKLVGDGVSIDKARAAIIDAMAEKQKTEQGVTRGQHVEAGKDASEKRIEGARNWIMQKAGLRHLFGDAGANMDPGEFRGLTLVDLARDSLERDGVRTRGMSKLDVVGRALTHRSAYNGTSDFSTLLETAMHKTLLASFVITPDTWRRFCKVGSVSDFRAHNRYRLGSFGTLDSLNEHGEFKQKQIPDGAKESITAATKGNIIGLTRQAIINDDMGAFNGLATAFGRASKLSIEVDVYAFLALNSGLGGALSDTNPVFHARTNADNISTGAALSASAIEADRVKMGSIKDVSGNDYLDLRPAVLLVPLSLGATARTINDSQYDPDTVANKAQMKPNQVRGLFRDVIDTPRLSGTRRYLFADPNIAPVIEVAFLDGQQEPFLDNQNGWRVDGVEWKVRLDYAVAGVGYEGAITNAGA